jgi:hypothetical protein
MPIYQSLDPNTEIIGAAILGSLSVMDAEHIQPLLEKHGLGSIRPDIWYPLDMWLAFLTELSEYRGAMFDFVSIGMKIIEKTAELMPAPPEVAALPFEQRMQRINEDYHMQYRNGDVGNLTIEPVGEQHLKITDTTASPSDLLYGVMWATARLNLPPRTHFALRYDETLPIKEKGGKYTVIHLTW